MVHRQRIYPSQCEKHKKKKIQPNRLKNVGNWLITLAGMPLAYILLPVSCCIRNPAAVVMARSETQGSTSRKKEGPSKGDEMMIENMVTGCYSACCLVSCFGCFCGCCGKFGPEEVA
jgi:hypothetical protein